MTKKKIRTKKQRAGRIKSSDERITKILGISLFLIAFYLLVAFTSYLFTWKVDQDDVLRLSWDVLFDGEVEMANWLGRLGAMVSNLFFYFLYGLPSFFIIPVLGFLGYSLYNKVSVSKYFGAIGLCVSAMIFLSVLLEFVLGGALFPWGGAFGQSVSEWLTNFIGTAGTIALLFFVILAFVIWMFNPDFHMVEVKDVVRGDTQSLRNAFSRKGKIQEPASIKTLRPTGNYKGSYPIKSVEDTNNEEDSSQGQLSFDIDKPTRIRTKKAKEPNLDLGLEIEDSIPKPAPPIEKPKIDLDDDGQLRIEKDNQVHTETYDPTLDLSKYVSPPLELLESYADHKVEIDRAELEKNKDQIVKTLFDYKIEITKIRATIGPTVTLYEIVPAPGIRISKIKNLEDDIALSLSALGIRIIAPIPGKGTIGIEVPNKNKQIVSLREVINSEKFNNAKMDLPIAIGKTISNEVFVADLAKMPHLLIAGATGQGKSVGINTILVSLLYKKHPSQIKFVMIDPKKVELFPYSKLYNHFLAYLPGQDEPIITDTQKVVHTLNSLIIEMDERYNLLKKAHARNIKEYNQKFVNRRLNPLNGHKYMPFIILVIDEFADLIMTAGKEIELPIGRLAQLSRAVGIHLIIATQRPSVNIITGVIKANFPARIAFKVTSKVDSRVIMDEGGAERLIGRGDMLLKYGGSDLVRLQCAFVDTPEIERVMDHIHDQKGFPIPFFLPEYSNDEEMSGTGGLKPSDLDELFEDAARLIVMNQVGSTSMIQRKLKLGYNRAGRIMDQLEAFGIVGASEGSKAREVYIHDEVSLMKHIDQIKNQ